MKTEKANQLRCPVCGGVDFIHGASRDIAPDMFIPMKRTAKQQLFAKGELLQPIKCKGCGLVLNFGAPEQ